MAIISNGTTIADAGAFSASLGSMVHIKTVTASSSADVTFVHGTSSVVLDGTYPVYLFKLINPHPATAGKLKMVVQLMMLLVMVIIFLLIMLKMIVLLLCIMKMIRMSLKLLLFL